MGRNRRRLAAIGLLLAAFAATLGAQTRFGRLFDPLDLGLYEAPDREQWQKPEQIMDWMKIADGSVVAEIGAGGGWFTVRLARRVGPNGRVYAEDVQPPMLEVIRRRAQRENLTNIQIVLGAASDPRLPPGLDAVLIVSAYPEIDEPVALLRNLARSLKPGGRIGVVDFLPGDGGPGPPADQRGDPEQVIREAAAANLDLLGRETIPPFMYLLIFRPAATVPARASR